MRKREYNGKDKMLLQKFVVKKKKTNFLREAHKDEEEENDTQLDMDCDTKHIKFNVGGYKYTTTMTTLSVRGPNLLTTIAGAESIVEAEPDEDGYIFLDRDGACFGVILNYLRTGNLIFPPNMTDKQISLELNYYMIKLPDTHRLSLLGTFEQEVKSIVEKHWPYISKHIKEQITAMGYYYCTNNILIPYCEEICMSHRPSVPLVLPIGYDTLAARAFCEEILFRYGYCVKLKIGGDRGKHCGYIEVTL